MGKNKYEKLIIHDFTDVYDFVDTFVENSYDLVNNDEKVAVTLYGKSDFINKVFTIIVKEYNFTIGTLKYASSNYDDEYEKEYCLSISFDGYLSIDKAYFEKHGEFILYDCYSEIPFIYQEDCSQELIDHILDIETESTLFGFNEGISKEKCECDNCCKKSKKNEITNNENEIIVKVNGEKVSGKEYDEAMKQLLTNYCEAMDRHSRMLEEIAEIKNSFNKWFL